MGDPASQPVHPHYFFLLRPMPQVCGSGAVGGDWRAASEFLLGMTTFQTFSKFLLYLVTSSNSSSPHPQRTKPPVLVSSSLHSLGPSTYKWLTFSSQLQNLINFWHREPLKIGQGLECSSKKTLTMNSSNCSCLVKQYLLTLSCAFV